MNKSNSANKQFFYNILSRVTSILISTITLGLFTRLLGAEQYSLYSMFSTWSAIIVPIMCLEMASSLSVAYYDFKDDYENYQKSILLLGTILFIIFTVVGIVFCKPLSKLLFYSEDIVIVLIIYSFANFITSFVQNVLMYKKKAKENFFISLIINVSGVLLSYYLITNGSFNELYKGRIYGYAIPYIIAGIIFWCLIVFRNKKGVNTKYWKYAVSYGLPVVLHILSHDALNQSNKIMLQNLGYAGSALGVYSFYQSLVTVLSTLCMALNSSWIPFYYDFLTEGNKEVLKKKTNNYMELFTVLTVGFVLLSREVSYLFATEEFWSGINVIPLLVLPIYLMFMYQFPVNFEYYCKKTKMIPIGTICSGLANIALNYFLIPKYGFYGSSIATIISYCVLFIIHYIISINIKEKEFNLTIKDYLPGLLMVLLSVVCFYILSDLWIIRWIIGAALGIYELRKIIKRKQIF